jgi:hypothetical protein
MSSIRIKAEDIKKIADYIDKNAKGELISIRIELKSLILNFSTIQRDNVTIKAVDNEYSTPVKIQKEENL